MTIHAIRRTAAAAIIVTMSVTQAAAQAVSYTAAQAMRGAGTFASNCAKCHGDNAQGGDCPPLVGAGFDNKWRGKAADELFRFIAEAMPADEPGKLAAPAYADVLAFLLRLNGVAAGNTALTPNPAGTVPAR